MIGCTRPFLEAYLRERLMAHANIPRLKGRARGLRFTSGRVSGVLFSEGNDAGAPHTLPCDLVVDAMGRSSRLGEWLSEAGWQPPALERLHVDLGYATGVFARDPADSGTLAIHSLVLRPGRLPLLSTMTAVEGNRSIVTIAGYAQDRPTRDVKEFLEWCRQDPSGEFGRIVDQHEMLEGVTTFRYPDNRRKIFSRLSRFPGGLLALGDSVASFNPIRAQGMSSACLHAACLDDYLRGKPSLADPARGYFESIGRVVDAAWMMSTTSDSLLPHSNATPTRGDRAFNALNGLVFRASVVDREVHRRFLDVVHMRAHPRTLMRPGTLLRAARRWRTDISLVGA
ncbi:NAD(P)/FAD-dependent oxidoreductase [Acrocarpospora catenulata]|uniref:NAD(P)/FAD-dependent oxidoreductase n=1 Tax=Acrocarpospora catenulata TaxID=2836182 RepID=UPI001BDA4600|nr:hypothetical protein [Acrocarpospora catenulata]